jgi:hypothetical protein
VWAAEGQTCYQRRPHTLVAAGICHKTVSICISAFLKTQKARAMGVERGEGVGIMKDKELNLNLA